MSLRRRNDNYPSEDDEAFLIVAGAVLAFDASDGNPLPVALAVHLDDGGVVDKAVDRGHRHCRIGEDVAPSREGLVGRYGDAVSLIAVADEFEQHTGFGLILAHIGQVIEDDQVVFVQFIQGGSKSEVATGGLEPLDHVGRAGEEYPPSRIDQGVTDGGHRMRFAGAAFAEDQQVVSGLDPAVAGSQCQQMIFADTRSDIG